MSAFFTRERFGRPQVVAAILLLAFLGQCCWLVARRPANRPPDEVERVMEGRDQWLGQAIAGTPYGRPAPLASEMIAPDTAVIPFNRDGYDPDHSPAWYLIASSANLAFMRGLKVDSGRLQVWLSALPFLIFGVLLGGSIWYVARRLYGNAGGYVALALYCFSPGMIQSSSLWFSEPESGAAWGTFGAIFTGIAVAHTLYAPREVILWNWRRIVLLGLSFALAVGSEFQLVMVAPLALVFMLYLAPTRRGAVLVIWATACVLAVGLIYTPYFVHPEVFWRGMAHANFFPVLWRGFWMPGAYERVMLRLGQSSPALLVAAPAAVVTYIAWPRTRYFGNTAPLLMAVLFLLLAVGTPHSSGAGYELMAMPFLFVFVAGIATDLLESQQAGLVFACLAGVLGASALWNVWSLIQVGGG